MRFKPKTKRDVIHFKVKPKRSSCLYFNVWIYPTHKAMVAEWPDMQDAEAFCSPLLRIKYSKPMKAKTLPVCGDVCFNKEYMPYPVVIHEFGHAAFAWARRKKLKLNTSDWFDDMPQEEQLLQAQMEMVFRFFEKLKELDKRKTV